MLLTTSSIIFISSLKLKIFTVKKKEIRIIAWGRITLIGRFKYFEPIKAI